MHIMSELHNWILNWRGALDVEYYVLFHSNFDHDDMTIHQIATLELISRIPNFPLVDPETFLDRHSSCRFGYSPPINDRILVLLGDKSSVPLDLHNPKTTASLVTGTPLTSDHLTCFNLGSESRASSTEDVVSSSGAERNKMSRARCAR